MHFHGVAACRYTSLHDAGVAVHFHDHFASFVEDQQSNLTGPRATVEDEQHVAHAVADAWEDARAVVHGGIGVVVGGHRIRASIHLTVVVEA